MTVFWNITRAEQHKLLRRRLLAVELVLLTLMLAGLSVVFYVIIPTLPDADMSAPIWTDTLIMLVQFASMSLIGGIIAVVLVGAVVAQSYQWRTLHLWLSHGTPRPLLLGAKAVALLVALLLVPLVALLLVGPFTALLLAGQEGATLNIGDLHVGAVLFSVLRAMLTLLPYAALALLLAVVTRSPVAPIGGGIGVIVAEMMLASLVGSLGGAKVNAILALLPSGLSAIVLETNNMTSLDGMLVAPPDAALPFDPWLALVGIAVWTLALLLPAFWVFRRQDLTG
jgi:ABC-type transport system involved in multi-copper enzyme maturation permease subunit